MTESSRPAARSAGGAFVVSAGASIGLMATYIAGGQPQLEGILIALALGGLGVGLIVWAKDLMPSGRFVEERHEHESGSAAQQSLAQEFEAGREPVARRTFLVRSLVASLAALGAAALFPIRSFGRGPGRDLFHTAFRSGTRLVTAEGSPIRSETLDVGGILTVFPEGATGAADSQTVLIKVDLQEFQPVQGREDWAPEGLVAYSKICTHAGCPVGLYQRTTGALFCPCHQSIFDAWHGARPTEGPATRPLPQLPLEINDDGYIVAGDDYPEPVGPGFWEL
jgi:ubiquinol-cytochrome c reductase iron-sulfur subunit